MKNTKAKINIKDIVLDETLYPRNDYSWQTAYDYSESMKSGVKFPRIVLAKYRNIFLLIDGRHRLEALKLTLGRKKYNKAKIETEILWGLNKAQMLEEAVKRNIGHGRALSIQEKLKVALKFKDLGYDQATISRLIQIPLSKLVKLQSEKITHDTVGTPIVLKKPMEHLGNKPLPSRLDDMEAIQYPLKGNSQLELLDNVLTLLTSKTFDMRNKKIKDRLKHIKILLKKLKL